MLEVIGWGWFGWAGVNGAGNELSYKRSHKVGFMSGIMSAHF